MADTAIKIDDKQIRILLSDLIKNTGKISQRSKDFVSILSAVVLKDIEDHFNDQRGPNGPWPPWSQRYAEQMAKRGKSGNFILTDTGRLRKGWQPVRYRASKEGILWFNPVRYAKIHDEGLKGMPKRQFAWISNTAIGKMEEQVAKFFLRYN